MTNSLVRTPGQSPLLPGTVSAGGFTFTSGLVSPSALAAIESGVDSVPAEVQIRETVTLLRTSLAEAGTTLDRVVRVESYLSSADLIGTWNEVFLEVWPEPGPARITLVAGFISPVLHFELQAVAFA